MRFIKSFTVAAALTVAAGAAVAQDAGGPKIYPYPSKANYCPEGLQPVTMDGVICCGQPNQTITYQQAMAHPAQSRRAYVRRGARVDCPVGTKGCTYN